MKSPSDANNGGLDAARVDAAAPHDGGAPTIDAQTPVDARTPDARPPLTFECDHTPCRVMPLGDSITDGYNVPGGYRIRLWSLAQAAGRAIDFVGSERNGPPQLGDKDHQGHSGWTIEQIHDIAAEMVETYDPDIVLLHIGTNDALGSTLGSDAPARIMAGQLEELLDTITATSPDVLIVLATIIPLGYPTNEVVQGYNARLPAIVAERAAAGYAIELLDMYAAVGVEHLVDYIHPTDEGYDLMADAWWPHLEPRLGD